MTVNNGDKAWELLVAQVARIERLAQSTDQRLGGIEAKVSNLACGPHGETIRANAEAVKEIQRTLDNRLNWKSVLVAVIGALTAGAMAGSRFL